MQKPLLGCSALNPRARSENQLSGGRKASRQRGKYLRCPNFIKSPLRGWSVMFYDRTLDIQWYVQYFDQASNAVRCGFWDLYFIVLACDRHQRRICLRRLSDSKQGSWVEHCPDQVQPCCYSKRAELQGHCRPSGGKSIFSGNHYWKNFWEASNLYFAKSFTALSIYSCRAP